jgi:hypothetical protein
MINPSYATDFNPPTFVAILRCMRGKSSNWQVGRRGKMARDVPLLPAAFNSFHTRRSVKQ